MSDPSRAAREYDRDVQDAHAFQFERQLFAANGYAVLNINYRGSSGRGAKFRQDILANWGVLEVDDVLAGSKRW